jgi:hypothetical protein
MTTRQLPLVAAACAAFAAVAGCRTSTPPTPKPPAGAGEWTAHAVAVAEGFKTPESVLADAEAGLAYVANVDTDNAGPWEDDGKGFLSRLRPDGELEALRWRDSTAAAPLNGPKGMCILGGVLYVADITRVMSFSLADGKARQIDVPGARRLNDAASDGRSVFVSDTGSGKIHRLDEKPVALKAPPSVNGITFHKGGMFAVSWGAHDVYELDPAGQADPKPFGLAKRFRSLDGIEALDDGTLIVSDFLGGEVCAIQPDRKTVATLCRIASPADIGLDRKRMLLYVPSFEANKVHVLRLERQ